MTEGKNTARMGSEIKQNNPALMSAVKPTRLSFKHIIEPNEGNTTTGSPFKKRLGDLFSNNRGFAFEDIILQTASPEKRKGGYMEGSPSRNGKGGMFEIQVLQLDDNNGHGSTQNTEQDDMMALRINRNLVNTVAQHTQKPPKASKQTRSKKQRRMREM